MHLLIYSSVFDLTANIDGRCGEFKTFESVEFVDSFTGVLFCDRHRCLEVIEGGEGPVRRRFDNVAKDPRFSDVQMLVDEPVEKQSLSGRRSDSFLVEFPELVTPESLARLRALYGHHFPMSGADFVLFLEDMIEALDRFGILQQARAR